MEKCMNCGAEIDEGEKLCKKCGAAGVDSGTSAGAAGVDSGTSAGAGAAGGASSTSAGAAGVASGTSTSGTFASLGAGAKVAIIVGTAAVIAAVGIGVGILLSNAEEPPPALEEPPPIVYDVGDIIQFGEYDWRVLEVQDGKALIISEGVLENRSYHDIPGLDPIIDSDGNKTWTAPDGYDDWADFWARGWREYPVTWATSDMRAYLNGEFYNSFSESDRARIADANVTNSDNPWTFYNWDYWWYGHESGWDGSNTPGGADTADKVFLLSLDEVVLYFGDSGMLARGVDEDERDEDLELPDHGIYIWGFQDEYGENRIAHHVGGTYIDPWGEEHTPEEGTASWWWLRSPGGRPTTAAYVGLGSGGGVDVSGNRVHVYGGVRPALWLILE